MVRHGDVSLPLTERVSDELRDGANGVIATGKAEKWQDDDRIGAQLPGALGR